MTKQISKFDNETIELSSVKIAQVIIDKIAKEQDWIIRSSTADEKLSVEEKKEINDKYKQFATETIQFLSSVDIEADYASYAFDVLIALLSALKANVDGFIRETRDEIVCRHIGVKSPRGLYRAEQATLGQLLMVLDQDRKATGNDPKDYLEQQETELSTGDTVDTIK